MKLFNFSKEKDLEIDRLNKLLIEKDSEIDLLTKDSKKYLPFIDKYKTFANAEKDFLKKIKNYNSLIDSKKNEFKDYNISLDSLNESILKLRKQEKELKQNVDLMSKNPIEFGIYTPIFNYDHSEIYKQKILENNQKQKELFLNNNAIKSNEDSIFYKSNHEFLTKSYKKSINSFKKIIALAFNSECDALISKVKWNNVELFKERIYTLFYKINSNSRDFCGFLVLQNSIINDYEDSDKFRQTYSNHMIILTDELLELKIEELNINHEYHLKKQEEKEEERRIKELIREEEKAQRDFEKSIREAEKKEQNLISKLRSYYSIPNQSSDLLFKIQELEKEIELLKIEKERAISMAQQTKCGFVYVISNIGSFGNDIIKIGMTRRLEPRDRIKELSNASVPFQYDIHTLIYSENAPKLEQDLHNHFKDYRINLVNHRKEFFKVPINEVEKELLNLGINSNIILEPEAKQYRESLRISEDFLDFMISKEDSPI